MKIGLALGGGTLRGMAHIGILEILKENDISIDILTGCSSGALVSAAFACGKLKDLKNIALGLNNKSRRTMLDLTLTGEGIIKGEKLRSFFDFITGGKKFEDIKDFKLAFVATDALSGKEVVIEKGSIARALEITTALPGLAPLGRHEGRLVFDGGTAMMVPAKICYDLGAHKVIAVDVGAKRSFVTRFVGDARKLMRETRVGKMATPIFKAREKIASVDERKFLGKARELAKRLHLLDDYEHQRFGFLEAYLIGLRAISTDYQRGLFKDDDADIAIRPDVFHVRRMDVTRMRELIDEGRKATEICIRDIRNLLG